MSLLFALCGRCDLSIWHRSRKDCFANRHFLVGGSRGCGSLKSFIGDCIHSIVFDRGWYLTLIIQTRSVSRVFYFSPAANWYPNAKICTWVSCVCCGHSKLYVLRRDSLDCRCCVSWISRLNECAALSYPLLALWR